VHAAGKALHCMGFVHTALLSQLHCTLYLHQPHILVIIIAKIIIIIVIIMMVIIVINSLSSS